MVSFVSNLWSLRLIAWPPPPRKELWWCSALELELDSWTDVLQQREEARKDLLQQQEDWKDEEAGGIEGQLAFD